MHVKFECFTFAGWSNQYNQYYLLTLCSVLRNKTANQILYIIAEMICSVWTVENNFLIYLFSYYGTITHMLNFCTPPNRPFPSSLCPCFKTSPSAKPFIWKSVVLTNPFKYKSSSFSYERLCTWTRFETEIEGNKEMACQCCLVALTIAELQDKFVMCSPTDSCNFWCVR